MDMDNSISRRITVAEMAPHVHSFLPNENKVEKISKWLINWIQLSLDCGKIKPYDLLPTKGDLACHIGVSLGTIQNVFRLVEDEGFVESKQRIGTYIKSQFKFSSAVKLTSKRELAIEIVKKFIQESGSQVGDLMISIRKLADMTGISAATIRMAFINLVSVGVLRKERKDYIINSLDFDINIIKTKTLVEKLADNIKNYVETELKVGDTLPSSIVLAKKFNTSVKTVHDAVKLLSKEGLLLTRRGHYGTVVLDMYSDNNTRTLYDYEKFEQKIRNYISENCNVGDKLPSIREFAEGFQTSEKTIKRALDNLVEEGYLTYARGRYGGTFVLDIPQNSVEAYKWLAISSDYVSEN